MRYQIKEKLDLIKINQSLKESVNMSGIRCPHCGASGRDLSFGETKSEGDPIDLSDYEDGDGMSMDEITEFCCHKCRNIYQYVEGSTSYTYYINVGNRSTSPLCNVSIHSKDIGDKILSYVIGFFLRLEGIDTVEELEKAAPHFDYIYNPLNRLNLLDKKSMLDIIDEGSELESNVYHAIQRVLGDFLAETIYEEWCSYDIEFDKDKVIINIPTDSKEDIRKVFEDLSQCGYPEFLRAFNNNKCEFEFNK